MPSLFGCSMLLYGPPKIGKSSFCAGLDDCAMLAFEPGLRWIDDKRVAKRKVTTWKEFIAITNELAESSTMDADNRKGKVKPKHLCIDTVDIAWVYCMEFICKKHGFEHPSDESYGKGYQVLRYEFQKQLARLNSYGGAMVLVSHCKTVESRGRQDSAMRKLTPSIPGSAREVVIPMVDIIGYCGFDVGLKGHDRALIFKPTEDCEAGDRSGRLPAVMPLDARELDKYFTDGSTASVPSGRKVRTRIKRRAK